MPHESWNIRCFSTKIVRLPKVTFETSEDQKRGSKHVKYVTENHLLGRGGNNADLRECSCWQKTTLTYNFAPGRRSPLSPAQLHTVYPSKLVLQRTFSVHIHASTSYITTYLCLVFITSNVYQTNYVSRQYYTFCIINQVDVRHEAQRRFFLSYCSKIKSPISTCKNSLGMLSEGQTNIQIKGLFSERQRQNTTAPADALKLITFSKIIINIKFCWVSRIQNYFSCYTNNEFQQLFVSDLSNDFVYCLLLLP